MFQPTESSDLVSDAMQCECSISKPTVSVVIFASCLWISDSKVCISILNSINQIAWMKVYECFYQYYLTVTDCALKLFDYEYSLRLENFWILQVITNNLLTNRENSSQ